MDRTREVTPYLKMEPIRQDRDRLVGLSVVLAAPLGLRVSGMGGLPTPGSKGTVLTTPYYRDPLLSNELAPIRAARLECPVIASGSLRTLC